MLELKHFPFTWIILISYIIHSQASPLKSSNLVLRNLLGEEKIRKILSDIKAQSSQLRRRKLTLKQENLKPPSV